MLVNWYLAALAAIALSWSGCAPSLRSAHGAQRPVIENGKYLVSPGWDYRLCYRVPPERLRSIIASYAGTPYRKGGMSRKGIDCSGFVCVVFRELNHARMPRTARRQSRLGKPVALEDAQAGDLVFFVTGQRGIDHVGIYVGDDKFAHASTAKGVIISDLASGYYRERAVCVRRIF